MTQSNLEFANKPNQREKQMRSNEQITQTKTGQPGTSKTEHSPTINEEKQNYDILLNNFQIKRKSYRVLFQNDHVVWEKLHAVRDKNAKGAQQQSKAVTKRTEQHEHEQLSSGSEQSTGTTKQFVPLTYGNKSHILHIDNIITVRKGDTKHATEEILPFEPSLNSFNTRFESVSTDPAKPTAKFLSIHYAERILKSSSDVNRWHVRHITLYNSDPYIVRQWCQTLLQRLTLSSRLHVRRLLVFINPYGGRKQGLQTYERKCKPLFQLAGIDASCMITQRANQIRDILMTHDLTIFDAVCCVGGDGTVADVINGLIFRKIRDLGLDEQRPAYIPKPMLPVAVIPAGSTDTIAYSMHGTSDAHTAAIHLILGQRRGLDICSIHNRNGLLRFCASVLSYGYLGDVAAKSEQYRWMGTRRYEYTGVKAFVANRGYDAELRILIDDVEREKEYEHINRNINDPTATTSNNSMLNDGVDDVSVCYANCKRCSAAVSMQESLEPDSKALYTMNSIKGTVQAANTFEESSSTHGVKMIASPSVDDCLAQRKNPLEKLQEDTTTPVSSIKFQVINAEVVSQNYQSTGNPSSLQNNSYNNPVSPKWEIIKGKFFMICGANITCACSRSPNGLSRYSHLGDGYLDLILVRKTTLVNNLRFLLNTAGRNGDIRNLPFVEVYRTRKFNFRTLHSFADETYSITGSCQPIAESFPDADSIVSSWNCDGEVVTDLDITMSSHCQLIEVFMRGPNSYNKSLISVRQTDSHASNSIFCCCKD